MHNQTETIKMNECTQRLTQLVEYFQYVTPLMSHQTLISFSNFDRTLGSPAAAVAATAAATNHQYY